ncbi:MAG TPA: hypothetical protein DEF47_08375 [Herpetosiphon sp.]|nr:hypothetical protein [Herpetosiphon sp.]
MLPRLASNKAGPSTSQPAPDDKVSHQAAPRCDHRGSARLSEPPKINEPPTAKLLCNNHAR